MTKQTELEMFFRFCNLKNGHGNGYTNAKDFMLLRKLANNLSKLDTDNCNGVYQNDDDYWQALGKIEAKISIKCLELGLKWYHQTDPRGASLYIDDREMTQADYTQGLAIY